MSPNLTSSVPASDKLTELCIEPLLASRISKSSVDVDLSSVIFLAMSSVDVETVLVIFSGGRNPVWLHSASRRSHTPSHKFSSFVDCIVTLASLSLVCSLRSESTNQRNKRGMVELRKKLWVRVGSDEKHVNFLPNELIRIKLLLYEDYKIDISSVNPSSERMDGNKIKGFK